MLLIPHPVHPSVDDGAPRHERSIADRPREPDDQSSAGSPALRSFSRRLAKRRMAPYEGAVSEPFSRPWLTGDRRARGWLPRDFRNPAHRKEAVEIARQRPLPPEVLAALLSFNATLPASQARDVHLDALAKPGTTVVVAGQQVGLFLGPLCTFHKAATCVAVARALEAETGHRVVPVFWLQTEDHDAAEIASCTVQEPGGGSRVFRGNRPPSNRRSVSELSVGAEAVAALETLRASLGDLDHGCEFLDLLSTAYSPDASYSAAFAQVLAALFADEGLVLLDPRRADFAACARPVHSLAMELGGRLGQLADSRAERLRNKGFRVQVPIRRDASLSCFHPDGPGGPRYRLIISEDGWRLAGGSEQVFQDEELAAALASEPRSFSTTALLRPILQDTLLPTAAYVAGPDEASSLIQLPTLYEHLELPMPLVIPRGRFRWVEPPDAALLLELGIPGSSVAQPPPELLAQLADPAVDLPPPGELQRYLVDGVANGLRAFREDVAELDSGLVKAIEQAENNVVDTLAELIAHYRRALGEREATLRQQVERLRSRLFPDGKPMERAFGLPYLACRFGVDRLKAQLMDAYTPFDPGVIELTL